MQIFCTALPVRQASCACAFIADAFIVGGSGTRHLSALHLQCIPAEEVVSRMGCAFDRHSTLALDPLTHDHVPHPDTILHRIPSHANFTNLRQSL